MLILSVGIFSIQVASFHRFFSRKIAQAEWSQHQACEKFEQMSAKAKEGKIEKIFLFSLDLATFFLFFFRSIGRADRLQDAAGGRRQKEPHRTERVGAETRQRESNSILTGFYWVATDFDSFLCQLLPSLLILLGYFRFILSLSWFSYRIQIWCWTDSSPVGFG